jgi:membrane-bound acyltransferase YfiQ involved in biofilm formation
MKIQYAIISYIITVLIIIILKDIVTFHSCLNNKHYFTPWYSRNWIIEPYTNFRVLLNSKKSRLYNTRNGVGDKWLCKETLIKDKKFWTIIKTIKKADT